MPVFGGVYNHISKTPHDYPMFEKAYTDLNIPAALGEPEMPYAVKFADAVYKMPTTMTPTNSTPPTPIKDPAEIMSKSGTCSYDYAGSSTKVFELVCEVYYYNRPGDLSPTSSYGATSFWQTWRI